MDGSLVQLARTKPMTHKAPTTLEPSMPSRPGSGPISTRPRRACILGASLDVGNRGVLALGISVAALVNRFSPGAIAFHYPHHSGDLKRLAGDDLQSDIEVEVLNCRMSPRSALPNHIVVILVLALLHRCGFRSPAERNPWLRSLLTADFIGDITGGDSFSDIYGFRRFLLGSLPLVSVALLGRPFTMLPQTYGPFRWPASRALARVLLRAAAVILTRDRHCAPLVNRLCGRTPVFTPDVAFTLEARKPQVVEFTPGPLHLNRDELIIGVNVSGLLYMGGYTGRNMFGLRSSYRELIDQLVESLLRSTDAKILLVAHVFGPEREEEACASLLKSAGMRHPGRVFALAGQPSERELKWVLGQTQFVVGSRMHACIAALSQCVPAVGLAYSDKFLGVFDSVGMGSAIIDLRSTEIPDVIARTLSAWHRRTEITSELQQRMPSVRSNINETFRALLSPTHLAVD